MKYFFPFLLFFLPAAVLPAQWESVSFQDAGGVYSASSELEKPDSLMDIGRYSPRNLFDHNTNTAWVEGDAGSGEGSYIMAGIRNGLKKYVIIYNGYQQSENLFNKNNRVKIIEVTLHAGYYTEAMTGQTGFEAKTLQISGPVYIALKDIMGPQRFKLPFDPEKAAELIMKGRKKFSEDFPSFQGDVHDFFFIKFEIVSVYKGSKWDDTCIAGIEFTDNPHGLYIPINEKITGLYQKNDEGSIYVRISSGDELVLVDADQFEDKSTLLDILDASPDNEWVIIAAMQGGPSGGRVEEINTLWSVRRMAEVSSGLLGRYKAGEPLDFTVKGDRLCLETMSGTLVYLEDIALDMDNGF